MQARYYAQALIEFLNEHPRVEPAGAIERLVHVLKHRGHEKLLPRIVREFEKEYARRESRSRVVISIAHESDRKEALQVAAEIAGAQGVDEHHMHTNITPDLLSGFTLRGPGFRYDHSGRKKLLELYKTLTA